MFNLTDWIINLIPSWVPVLIILTSIATFIISSIAGILPGLGTLYKEAIKIISILVFSFGFYLGGALQYANHVKIQTQKVIEYVDRVKTEQVVVTKEVVKWYKVKEKNIGDNYGNLKKSINTNDDSMCTVPKSFVQLHDTAAENSFPDTTTGTNGSTTKAPETPASGPTGQPSGVPLSGVENTITSNYEQYYEIANRLEQLQDWVKKEKEANP